MFEGIKESFSFTSIGTGVVYGTMGMGTAFTNTAAASTISQITSSFSLEKFKELEESTKSSIPVKDAKLWNIFHRKIKQGIEENVTDPEKIREVLLTNIRSFLERSEFKGHFFAQSLITDLESKTLSALRNKYLSRDWESKTDFSIPFALDILKLFSNFGEYPFDINDLILQEENALKNRLQEKQLPLIPANRDEMMRLLTYRKENPSQKNFHCYVMELHELEGMVNEIQKILPKEGVHRFQFLVRNGFHYTAIDMELHGEKKRCIVMDAASDSKYKEIVNTLKSLDFNEIYVAGNDGKERIQHDHENCAYFSLEHALKSARMPGYYQFLESHASDLNENGVREISWYFFPPEFIKHAQSKTFMNNYIGNSLSERTSNLKKHFEPRVIEGATKDVNISMERKQKKLVRKLTELFDRTSNKTLSEIAYMDPISKLHRDFRGS